MKPNAGYSRHIKKMRMTVAERDLIYIRRCYECIRKKFFKRSALPPVEAVLILYSSRKRMNDLHRSWGCYDESYMDCLGFYGEMYAPHYGLIVIDDGLDEVTTIGTLIHEMAHMAVEIKHKRNMGHGKVWQAEMLRLARAGAFKTIW